MKTKADYLIYLKGEHWKNLRLLVLKRDGWCCVRCPQKHHLEVHHRFYRHTWEESVVDDLETLCSVCHEREHKPMPSISPTIGVAGSKGNTYWNELGQKVTRHGIPVHHIRAKAMKRNQKRIKKWLKKMRRI